MSGILMLIAALAVAHTSRADTPPPSPSLDLTPTAAPTFSTTPVAFTVTGTVTTGSPGISVPAKMPVTLHVLTATKAGTWTESVTRNGALDDKNQFRFEGITAIPGDFQFVTTDFQGVTQGSLPAQIANNQATLDSPVTLYAVTRDPAAIQVNRARYIVNFGLANLMYILVTYQYTNTSDHLYMSNDKVGDIPISVKIPLPVGARAVAFNTQIPDRFIIGGDANAPIIEDTRALTPGEFQELSFSFQLPYDDKGKVPLDQDILYATQSFEVLIPDDANAGISEPKIARTPADVAVTADTKLSKDHPYTQYTVTDLKPGTNFVYSIGPGKSEIMPRPVIDSSKPDLGKILLGVGLLALLAGIGMVFVQRRSVVRK
jgi:hypothetical protein